MKKIIVKDLVGKNAISMGNGDKLHSLLHESLSEENKVEVDFEGVEFYASPFFNAAIGLLLNDFSIEYIQRNMKIVNLSDLGKDLLNHVISNAIEYYRNSEAVNKSIDIDSDLGKE